MVVLFFYVAFFIGTFPFSIRADRIFGMYYAALFIYSLFAIFGYLYLPGLSESISAYFGDPVGHAAALFCFASMAGFFAINYWLLREERFKARIFVTMSKNVTVAGHIFLGAIVFIFVFMMSIHFNELSWYIHEYASELDIGLASFLVLYKITVGLLAVCYVVMRSDVRCSRLFIALFTLYFLAFCLVSFKLGNRTDPAALLLGVLAYELYQRRIGFRTLAGAAVVCVAGILALSVIEYFRYTGGGGDRDLVSRIVQNDYYAPAHMLFASIAYNFIDAQEVFKSNFSNALVLLDYPYLQQSVTDLFRPGLATRSEGYAFYIFTEGWIVMGAFGVIYNWVVPTIGLMMWRSLACTDSKLANGVVTAVTACMILNLVRGQSSYFIKYLYTFAGPALLFFVILVGLGLSRAEPRATKAIPQ